MNNTLKVLAVIAMILGTQAVQAESRWWSEGGRHHDRYEHKIDHEVKQHKRKNNQHKKQHKKQHHNAQQKNYTLKHGHHDYHDDNNYSDRRDYKPRRWQKVSGFRGRSGRDVTRYIEVQDRVKALSIQGTKRAMYIREAHALLGNGRWIRVEGLEGYVARGERLKHRLRKGRYVQQIVLEVEPARYKRGYAQLLVRPVHH